MPPSRRRTLYRCGLALSTGLASTLAGCSLIGGDDRARYEVPERDRTTSGIGTDETAGDYGSAPRFEPVTVPDRGDPGFLSWLPAPDELPAGIDGRGPDEGGPGPPGFVRVVDVERYRDDDVPDANDFHRRIAETGTEYLGVGFDSYRRTIEYGTSTPRAVVVEADVETAAVREALLGTGYEPAGSLASRPLFTREDGPRAVAVGRDSLVQSKVPGADLGVDTAVGMVGAVLAARSGDADRLHEGDDAFARLAGLVDSPALALFDMEGPYYAGQGTSPVGGIAGTAIAQLFDADSTYTRRGYVYDRPLDAAAVREGFRERIQHRQFGRRAERVAVDVDGRTVDVRSVYPDERADRVFEDTASTYPHVTLGYDLDRSVAPWRLTVELEAGDEVRASALSVQRERIVLGEFSSEYDVVAPGDSLTVEVRPPGAGYDDRISVAWEPGEGVWTLGSYHLPRPEDG